MERTCAYQKLLVILLSLSKMTDSDAKEFYCTKEGRWKTAMSTCLDLDGTPMSLRDTADAADVKLKQGTTVWTTDYIYWETVENAPQSTEYFECGYMRFSRRWKGWSDFTYMYSSTTGIEYDDCSKRRLYFCDNVLKQMLVMTLDTWFKAYQSCKPRYRLWSGYNFTSDRDLGYSQIWVKSARKFIPDTLTGTIPNSRHIVKCGTSEGPVNRDEENNCEQHFQAVCILENKTDDARFSRSCLQEEPTTTPTTTASTQKTTVKTTRPTTELTTTVEPSLQSTKALNSTTSQSKPGELPKTIIIVIATTITTVIICCIVTVLLLFCFCRKRRKSDKAHSGSVKFKSDNQSTASMVLSINNNPDDKVTPDEADTTGYYEVHLDSKDANNIEAMYSNDTNNVETIYSNEKHNYDYGYAYSGSESLKHPYKTTRKMSISESEYDTTNNVKVFNESSNIYNKLGYETPEGVYDCTMSKPNRNPALDTNIYSKTSTPENFYDTTATVELGTARVNGAFVSPDSNVYGNIEGHENDDSRTYGNLVIGQQFLGTYNDDIESDYS